jgi:DNA polymerase III alpha subunit
LDTPSVLLDAARRHGVRHVALTDHDTLAGLEALAGRPGVIGGVELSVRDRSYPSLWGHLTVLFRLADRLQFTDIVLQANVARAKLLLDHLPDLRDLVQKAAVVLSGCPGSILYRYAGSEVDKQIAVLAGWKSLFGDRLFLEAMPQHWQLPAKRYVQQCTGLPLIVTTDAHGTASLPYWSEEAIRRYETDRFWQAGVTRAGQLAQRLGM